MAHKLLYNIYKWEKLYTIYEPLQLTVPRSLSFFISFSLSLHLLVIILLAGNVGVDSCWKMCAAEI